MSFDEIIRLVDEAEDFIDLYDTATYIEDDELRAEIDHIIDVCSEDNRDLSVAIKRIKNVLTGNEDKDKTIEDYIADINDASNDKDLLNIIDELDKDKAIDDELALAIRQLFRNNRYMSLNDKVDAILRLIQSQDIDVDIDENTTEQLTEAVDKEIEDKDVDVIDNDEKSDETIEEKEEIADEQDTEKDTTEMLKLLRARLGQQYSVGELNSVIQSLFGQYNKVFLLSSDLYNKDLDTTQIVEVEDDEDVYVLSYDIIDMDSGIVELVDVNMKG